MNETSSPFRIGVRDQSRQVPGLKLDRSQPDVALQSRMGRRKSRLVESADSRVAQAPYCYAATR